MRLRHAAARLARRAYSSSQHINGEEVLLALGSNQGDRAALLRAAVRALPALGVRVHAVSSLYETAPAHVEDQARLGARAAGAALTPRQPAFLNAVARCSTALEPEQLLAALKRLEALLGRRGGGPRFGPRPIDLDVLTFGARRQLSEALELPHPRAHQRPFVLAPLADVASGAHGPEGPAGQLLAAWRELGGEALVGQPGLRRCTPLPDGALLPHRIPSDPPRLMLVLNATPDSFSDGGWAEALGPEAAADAALAAAAAAGPGCILDVGGQSTRPGAIRVGEAEEAERALPLLRALAERGRRVAGGGLELPGGALLSVDTFYGSVALEAARLGCHVINDVSCAGRFDAAMLPAAAATGCAYVLTHSRAEPASMQQRAHTGGYGCGGEAAARCVAAELAAAAARAGEAGLDCWSLLIDPGLGFAKEAATSRALLRSLPALRAQLAVQAGPGGGALASAPLLVGPSRKRFLTSALPPAAAAAAAPHAADWATAAAVAAAVDGGADVVRVHVSAAAAMACVVHAAHALRVS